MPRVLFALAPPLCLLLIGVSLLYAGLPAPGVAAAPATSVADAYRYCYTWDFLNNTGQTADGLRIRLSGISRISAVYTGTFNPFGAPDASSGYDPVAKVYRLNFSNGVAYDGDVVRVGICTDQPALVLAPTLPGLPPFTWMAQGQALQPAPLFAGVTWIWQPNNHVVLSLRNSQGMTLTLQALNLLDPGVLLSLDDLNPDVVATLPAVAALVNDPLAVAPGASKSFDVALSAPYPNHPYVLEAVLSAEDDPGNVLHVYSQALYPPAVSIYFPVIFKQ